MFLACSLTTILLGYVFGVPVPFNSMQNHTRQYAGDTLQFNNTLDNATESSEFNNSAIIGPILLWWCPLSVCALNNLGHSMQSGDEKAGKATTDPHGIGKR
ncbi:hypothetical protein DPEC_G00107650 [Dallia pectoralis]|uniref:Uncharacterized protein n=1 Tax=Dallia pectoralis TaxID=75939 RepID=A0ACC2GS33_DALPE|nr:hypothetical protein DPEC_G00107650 [Dallia pectoralis]